MQNEINSEQPLVGNGAQRNSVARLWSRTPALPTFSTFFRLALIAGLTGLVALAVWPYHDGALRYGLPLSLLVVWLAGLRYCWRGRIRPGAPNERVCSTIAPTCAWSLKRTGESARSAPRRLPKRPDAAAGSHPAAPGTCLLAICSRAPGNDGWATLGDVSPNPRNSATAASSGRRPASRTVSSTGNPGRRRRRSRRIGFSRHWVT